MIHRYEVTWEDVRCQALDKAVSLQQHYPSISEFKIYGVPRGGIFAAQAISSQLDSRGQHPQIVSELSEATVIVDDIIDSGTTLDKYRTKAKHMGKKSPLPFVALFDKREKEYSGKWLSMPWERMCDDEEMGIEDNIRRIIEYIGDDPNREGLIETPNRIARSYDVLYGGYSKNPEDVIKVFEDGSCDEMVVLKGIEFASNCVSGDTFVETPKGRISIKRLKHGEFVYAWDEENNKMTIARALNPRITGRNKKLMRVYTDKETLLCTPDHKILTHERGWVQAKNLKAGDSVRSLDKRCQSYSKSGDHRVMIKWSGVKDRFAEHRFVYEQINGEQEQNICVHHIDKNPFNNSPENLTAMSRSEHCSLHRLTGGPTGFAIFTDDQRRSMKKKQVKGIKKSQTPEVRKKRSDSVKRYWASLSKEQKAERVKKMSEGCMSKNAKRQKNKVNHTVVCVEETEWVEDVWCMDVPVFHNFVANGMVVHNCEHHMLPFMGTAHIGYIPDGKVIGVSKLARLLEIYARRLQIQERIGQQVTDALMEHLQPKGCGCVLVAKHSCMSSRGVEKQHSEMVTSSMRGNFKGEENRAVKAEFLKLIGM